MTAQKPKYPRTYHLDFSESIHSDDKVIETLSFFEGKEIVITEKLDGESTTFAKDYYHARSVDSAYNFTRSWVKQLHSILSHEIPDGWRFCGENLSYYHSIEYSNLESYFYLFSIWDESNNRLHWDDMLEFAKVLDLATPQEFYRGTFDLNVIKKLSKSIDTEKVEGFVVTTVDGFHYDDFTNQVTKWVRKNHVQPSENGKEEHWLKRTYPNKLKDPNNVQPYYMRNIILSKNNNNNNKMKGM